MFISFVVTYIERINSRNRFISHFNAMNRLDRLESRALKPRQLKSSAFNQLVQHFCR
jgi:hypothetical protein